MRIERATFIALALGGASANLIACGATTSNRQVETSPLEEGGAAFEEGGEASDEDGGYSGQERGPVCDVWAEDGSCEEFLPMQECAAWNEDGSCALFESDADQE